MEGKREGEMDERSIMRERAIEKDGLLANEVRGVTVDVCLVA